MYSKRFVKPVLVFTSLILTSLASAQAQAEDGEGLLSLTGSAALVSDYRFRGISQTAGNETFQGSLELSSESGIYGGVWASGITDEPENNYEIDFYAGATRQLNDGTVGDIGFLYYLYPTSDDAGNLDYLEVYGSLTFANDLTLGLAYSPEFYGRTGDYVYAYLNYASNFSEWLVFGVHAGWNYFDKNGFFPDSTDSYFDWGVSISFNASGFDLKAELVGTDIGSDTTCFGDADDCEPTLILSVLKEF